MERAIINTGAFSCDEVFVKTLSFLTRRLRNFAKKNRYHSAIVRNVPISLIEKLANFEAVAITFKMDAKKNDRNEHEQKKRPLTSSPLCSWPHSPHSFLFS